MSELRIIAGQWRGRRIKVPPAGVRPTADRVREAWMSIVQPHIPDAVILDLCAGSGALGLEALSRGAAHCHFVESDPKVLRILQENIRSLGATERSTVHRMMAERIVDALHHISPSPVSSASTVPLSLTPRSFPSLLAPSIAFADPPYHKGISAALARYWLNAPFAAIFGIEHESTLSLPAPSHATQTQSSRRYGDTALTFYRVSS